MSGWSCSSRRASSVGAEQEHAAVPEVARRRRRSRCGGRAVGLLDEASTSKRRCAGQRRAAADVAVAGFRRGRRDAEGDQRAGRAPHGAARRPRAWKASASRITWSAGITSSTHRVVLGDASGRGGGDRRRGVAADRLQQRWRAASTPISRSCSAMRKRCSSLQITSGASKLRRRRRGAPSPAAGFARRPAAEAASG